MGILHALRQGARGLIYVRCFGGDPWYSAQRWGLNWAVLMLLQCCYELLTRYLYRKTLQRRAADSRADAAMHGSEANSACSSGLAECTLSQCAACSKALAACSVMDDSARLHNGRLSPRGSPRSAPVTTALTTLASTTMTPFLAPTVAADLTHADSGNGGRLLDSAAMSPTAARAQRDIRRAVLNTHRRPIAVPYMRSARYARTPVSVRSTVCRAVLCWYCAHVPLSMIDAWLCACLCLVCVLL